MFIYALRSVREKKCPRDAPKTQAGPDITGAFACEHNRVHL